MRRLNEQADEIVKLLDPINPIYYLVNYLDNRHDAYWQNVVMTDANERKIMDDLGYAQEQICPIE